MFTFSKKRAWLIVSVWQPVQSVPCLSPNDSWDVSIKSMCNSDERRWYHWAFSKKSQLQIYQIFHNTNVIPWYLSASSVTAEFLEAL